MSPTGQLPVEDIVMNDAGNSSHAGGNPGLNAEGNLGSSSTNLVGPIARGNPGSSNDRGQPSNARGTSAQGSAETPERATLRWEVQSLSRTLEETKEEAEGYVQHVKVDAANKARMLLKDQKERFARVAAEHEQVARDVCESEVAHNRAVLHSEALSHITARENQLRSVEQTGAVLRNRLNEVETVAELSFNRVAELKLSGALLLTSLKKSEFKSRKLLRKLSKQSLRSVPKQRTT